MDRATNNLLPQGERLHNLGSVVLGLMLQGSIFAFSLLLMLAHSGLDPLRKSDGITFLALKLEFCAVSRDEALGQESPCKFLNDGCG